MAADLEARAFIASGVIGTSGVPGWVSAFTIKGFTSGTVYNGTSNAGDAVLHLAGPGTVSLPGPVHCPAGVYVEVAGAGKGSVLI